jgi:hypothetical protein
MIQIFINEVELDLPANIGEQIAINFEAFPLGEFRNTFNNFSGNLTFPATAKNRLVFGNATNNLAPLTVTREYTGQILSGAIELFYGRVDYERFNNGFECRFVTSGQLLSEAIKQYDMFEVLEGLPPADSLVGEQWFDHQYNQIVTESFVGENANGGKNVRYPLLDLGYFNNTNSKIGYFDLRASFSLWTLCLAIAKKVNKTLTFNGTLPDRLFNTFITPKDWKYSDRIIEVNSLKENITNNPEVLTGLERRGLSPYLGVALGPFSLDYNVQQQGIYTNTVIPAFFPETYQIQSDFSFNTKFKLEFEIVVLASDVLYTGEVSRNGCGFQFSQDVTDLNLIQPTVTLYPDWIAGRSATNSGGVQPLISVYQSSGTWFIDTKARANQNGYGFDSTEQIYYRIKVSYEFEQFLANTDNFTLGGYYVDYGLYLPLAIGQTDWNADITFKTVTGETNVLTVTHDERIYANGLISGTDLMGSLKPADVLKYAMRLTGSYLVETDTTITLVPFGDYDKADAIDWSGKVNFLQQPIVDYRDNELGKDNWLVYQQDDTNTALDPYYLGGNLPTNLGTSIVTLYEAPFAQSAFNQTFNGSVSLVRVPYYDAPLAYFYRVWIDDSTAYTVGQFVGYLGRLFKVLANCLGSDGSPIVNTADYEEVDYSIFNDQSPEYRAIEVLTDQVTGVQIYSGAGNLLYTNTITAGLNGIDFQQAITDGYGFIPSTFLDYRQVIVQVSLSDLDIHNLNLKKLVFISELNAYFYINKVEEYTPDTNVDTTVTLTMLP